MMTTDVINLIDSNTTLEFDGAANFTQSFINSTTTAAPLVVNIKPYFQYEIFQTALKIYKHGWKVTVPPGLLGNTIIILVMMKMKPFNSTSLFMISLALVDLLTLCTRIPIKELRLETTLQCKVMWYLYNALPMYSNYILVFWTLERVIAVQFPLQASTWCTVKRTAIFVIATGVFSFAVNVAWPISIVSQSVRSSCRPSIDMMEFLMKVWPKVDASLFIFVPVIVIVLSNILIITRLQQSTKRHQQMTSSNEAREKREREQRNTTITLICVCIAFVLLHMPIAIYNCAILSRTDSGNQEIIAKWEFVNYFGMVLAEAQNSMNFYLYFLTGRRYREVTFSLLCPCRIGPGARGKKPESTMATGVSIVSETK